MKLRILIADDEAPARFGLSKALSSYDIIEASSGEEALASILTASPHLVLLDLNMPELDGLGGAASTGSPPTLARNHCRLRE